MNLHQQISFRHFASGVTHQPQALGWDFRDMERQLVPVLNSASTVTDDFIYAIRAMVEFIYHAQDPVYTDSSISQMEQVLSDFHSRKQCIIELGARRGMKGTIAHFKIPKLELMASFACQTKANSALNQYTADVSERLLITHCKTTFQHTSRLACTFTDQIVDILNREEAIQLFDLYLVLRMVDSSAIDTVIHMEHQEATMIDPSFEFIQHVLPGKVSTFCGPHQIHNHFQNWNSLILMDGEIALHVTLQPDHSAMSVHQMQMIYHLPNLPSIILCYIQDSSQGHPMCEWSTKGNVFTWNKFRIQLHSLFHGRYVEKSQVVQAYPSSEEHLLGHCDPVLLRHRDSDMNGMI